MSTLRQNPEQKRQRNMVAKQLKEGFNGEFRHKIHETPRKGRSPRHKIDPRIVPLILEEDLDES